MKTETITPNTIVQAPTLRDQWFNRSDPKWFDDNGEMVVPTEYYDNLRFRVWLSDLIVKGIDDDCALRRSVINRCKRDYMFFFKSFLWTKDPRKKPADLPFILYDYEHDYVTWLQNHIDSGKDCLTEKSRDMGASWCLMGLVLWHWMYKEGFLAHIGSKKEDDVDRSGDIRSLFEKLRYMLSRLPSWMLPPGFEWKKHSMFMRLINPYNNNSITGESSNRDFGRGGRYKMVILDEFASMEYADEAWTSTGDSTPCRIAASTPKGSGNQFWKLRFKSKIDIFTMHWTLHPEKSKDSYDVDTKDKLDRINAFKAWKEGRNISSPWYESEVKRRTLEDSLSKVDIAQELDIDYLASGDPYFDLKALSKQKESVITENWIDFPNSKGKVIIGNLVLVDNKIEFRPNKNGWLRLFEVPKREGQYCMALDAAEGLKSGDYCSGACRDKKTTNMVAGIYGNFDYDELSYYGYLTSRYFNNALICAEAGGYGAAVNKRLYDLGANVARAIDFTSGNLDEKDKLGFMMTSASRPKVLGDMEAEIREGTCELRDKDLISECMNFINKDNKPQASEGSNDDYIFAFGIAGQLLRFRPYSQQIEKEVRAGGIKRFIPKPNMGFKFKS